MSASGRVCWRPDRCRPTPPTISARCPVMANLERVLGGTGYALSDVVQARIYLTDFEPDYAAMNRTYASYFPVDRLPARTTIGVTGLAAVRWSKSPASSTMRSTSTISTLPTVFAVLAQRKILQNMA